MDKPPMTEYETQSLILLQHIARGIGLLLTASQPEAKNRTEWMLTQIQSHMDTLISISQFESIPAEQKSVL